MPRASTIDKMPSEVRAQIGRLLDAGRTIDEIVAQLRVMEGIATIPSRSAIGRHAKKMAAIGERMRRSRQVAEVLVRELGDAPESQTARLNIELMHSVILDLHMRSADGDEVDPDGSAALAGNPEGVMMLAKALDHITRASKSNIGFIEAAETRAETRARTAAVSSVEAVAKERGVSAETVEMIKARIFGVTA